MKALLIVILCLGIITLTGCSDKNIGDCNGSPYLINESHCVMNCPEDCYGITICGRDSSGCYPNYCYGWYYEGHWVADGCIGAMCNHGHYFCTTEIHTFAQDKIDVENKKIEYDKAVKEQNEEIACWRNGSFYNYTFDIIKDYNLSCSKLAYINDHLIDKTRQVDGGYISGQYSGFIARGHIESHLYQYVTEGVLATGTLVNNINYYTNCRNETKDKKISYYSESDFVMYYVNKCITG